eukprot:gnl/TRDRNA2_/TRDRNA2_201029_c0_seq1.p1 gnl/TRDRNA2_/TRDRNA2_201029_c0~~gnl/TRDRNA2_/TRDRNA2_201029_c0_seq1.p1  ORF type:complete len:295 (+),score=84.52 gnl/TRDRNA2_/TRDRNA2_201029_c0_seq1:39-887(+)
MAAQEDYYAVLGVPSTATAKEISKAFRAKARVLHPDKQPPNASAEAKNKAKKAFQQLARAYETLSDADKKRTYDLCRMPASSSAPKAGGRSSGKSGGYGPRFDPTSDDYGDAYFQKADEAWEKDLEKRRQEQERKKKQEEEERASREKWQGLGSHWVKPPPKPTGGAGAGGKKWDGWVQSGSTPDAPAGKKKKKDSDSDSDESSVLSFNWGIDIDDLDLDNLEPVTDEKAERERGGERWVLSDPKPKAKAKPEAPAPAAAEASEEKDGPKKKAAQPKCCVMQ